MLPSDDGAGRISAECIETGRFVVHPWHCDVNGHLNTRHFQGFFDDAAEHLLAECGHRTGVGGLSVVHVRCVVDYKAEAAPGLPVVVRSAFTALGTKSLTSVHALRSIDGALLATCEIIMVFFDLAARAGVAIPDHFRAEAERLLVSPAGPTS